MFKFKGISSKDMQVVVEEEEHFIAKASQRYEAVEIEGRDGAEFNTLGYSCIERPIYVQCLNINKIDDILAWLNGEGEFEYKGRKTIARFYSQLEPERSACIRVIDTTFIRDPFWNKADDEFILVKDRKDKEITGENITIEDGTGARFKKLTIKGNTWQETDDTKPSPENPSPIKNCGNINFKISNNNLKNIYINSKFSANVRNVEVNVDGNIWTLNGTANTSGGRTDFAAKSPKIPFKTGHVYTLYNEIISGSGTTGNLYITKEDGSSFTSCLDNRAVTLTNNSGDFLGYLGFNLLKETELNNLKIRVALFEGRATFDEIKTMLETYQEQCFTFPAKQGQVFHKGDYLADDGVHQIKEKRTFDGTESNWTYYQANSTWARPFIIVANKKIGENDETNNVLSNKFKPTTWGNRFDSFYGVFSYSEDRRISFLIPKSELSSLDKAGVQEYFKNNNVEVEYNLQNEIIEPYSPEQQEVWDNIKNTAHTYKGTTHIFCTDEISCEFEGIYIADTDEKIFNEGNIESRPIIRLEKTIFEQVEITINDVRFKYDFKEDEYVEIDCKEKTVEYKKLNRNRQIEIGYDFPILKLKNNNIIMHEGDCIVKVKRKDRWL